MKIYLSGAMTGEPSHGYPVFNETAKKLRDAGFTVLNPAENFGGDPSHKRSEYMRLDIQNVLAADAVAVLANWRVSKGAQLEVAIARELDLKIYDATKLVDASYINDPFGPGTLPVLLDPDVRAALKQYSDLDLDFARLDPESTLLEAHRLVHGDRGHNYGHPIDDFSRTAAMWTAMFGGKTSFGPTDVALGMIAVKLSRETNKPKRDNRVDIAGYAETLDMVHERLGS